jgi:transcriptional regulator with XRE-family HTH domain
MPATRPTGPQVPLRLIRQLRGWTQEDVAAKIRDLAAEGVVSDSLARTSHTTISNAEKGHKPASDRLLIAWAMALDIDPHDVWADKTRTPAGKAA